MKFSDLESCKLCSWECDVDRLAGEKGVCLMGTPKVASCQLHPAPPESYTIFTAGCNYKCLNCQNWEIAHYPVTGSRIIGVVDPKEIATNAINAINSPLGQLIKADRLFFSGGAPTVSLPWIEEVVSEAKRIDSNIKVNFDTNGFPTKQSFKRILSFSDSITFDIKAFHDEVHRTLTGAPVEPVLRNAEEMIRNKEKLWEFRILFIPSIIDLSEIRAISEFIVSLDKTVPVCFLSFRPNFVLDQHPGASERLMKKAFLTAQEIGLDNVSWAGATDYSGVNIEPYKDFSTKFDNQGALIAASYAKKAGCKLIHRYCGNCSEKENCLLKGYVPTKTT